ncbi:MAG: hypothetical protein JXR97_07740 [Planctomycetes bacterium]|nr:hypothetical protein [Planctomycetota bacterium]
MNRYDHDRSIIKACALLVILFAIIQINASAAEAKKFPVPKVEMKKGAIPEKPEKVTLAKNKDGNWRVYVEGKELPIRGAGGAVLPGMLEQLKAAGGNCVRTWGIGTLEDKVAGDERFIDRAYRVGIKVVPGIWVQHERHGFNYDDPASINKQREHVRDCVRKYKNHPAVLVWGLGNEMEGPTSATGSVKVFKEVEELAKIIKEEDPNHPIMTVIASSTPAKVKSVMEYCPSIDILGINTYSSASGTGESLTATGWSKPFAVTEFGVSGHWEVQKTSWGAPYEATSQEKARSFYASHTLVFDTNKGKELCLGTFAFLWGWKQECTSTWYGMYLPTMEKLPQVDAMTKAWTGEWPKNRCPKIKELTSPVYGKTCKPGRAQTAYLEVKDPDGDEMSFTWAMMAESTDLKVGGERESTPPSFPELIQKGDGPDCIFKSPEKTGNYRIFVTVHDGKGGAATANFPFRVE